MNYFPCRQIECFDANGCVHLATSRSKVTAVEADRRGSSVKQSGSVRLGSKNNPLPPLGHLVSDAEQLR